MGIIRGGKLLAVERIDEIRRGSVRRMVVRFAGEPPVAELVLPGVEIVEREGRQVVLRVSGELDPLLRVLASHRVGKPWSLWTRVSARSGCW